MTSLAIILALILHLTGLWSHLSPHAKTQLGISAQTIVPAPVVGLPSLPVAVASPAPLQLEPTASLYAVDVSSGQVLYAQNATAPRPIASVTKLMTVMVTLSKLKPDTIVTVGKLPDYQVEDETLGLKTGEQLAVSDLVTAALIPSDNDAADALGLATSGDLPSFYAAMNAEATKWGMTDAHFVSASGLIDTNNVVSAADVAKIASLALANPLVRSLVNQPAATISDSAGRTFHLTTTNDLLASGKFYGIKTGYTLAAGECFVGLTSIDGHQVITVVLGTSDRFGTTQTLVNWIRTNYTWL